tara:strand:- start:2135 stop:3232 length:1098 start_codon:yes stop_codon:yes gene_type:complete
MSETINIPFPNKTGYVENKFSQKDIDTQLLDWLIGCYDGGEDICALLPYYMANIQEIFEDKKNPNLDGTKVYLKTALKNLKNTRIDTAVQERINNKKLKGDIVKINFVDEELKDWKFEDIDTPKKEFVGFERGSTEKFTLRTEHRFSTDDWEEMEYTNSNPNYEKGVFSYTALPKPSTKDFLTGQIKKVNPKLEIKWGRSEKSNVELTSYQIPKKEKKIFVNEIGGRELDESLLNHIFQGVGWFDKIGSNFWKSKTGIVSNVDYLLNPYIIFNYDIKINIEDNKIGKIEIIANPQQEVISFQPTRGETRQERPMEEILSTKRTFISNKEKDSSKQANTLTIRDDLWRHLKGKMATLERYITEATA